MQSIHLATRYPRMAQSSSSSMASLSSRRRTLLVFAYLLLWKSHFALSFMANSPHHCVPQHNSWIRRWNANVWTNGEQIPLSSPKNETERSTSAFENIRTVEDDDTKKTRRMSLMWCDRGSCQDVVRERVVGVHNQIILNGPATGQVAYRWENLEKEAYGTSSGNISPSILVLVKPNDRLYQQAANFVPLLTKAGIHVLLVPDAAAELEEMYGVQDFDGRIRLFEPPAETNAFKNDRNMDDKEEHWVKEMMSLEPFPDLVCTIGGDGLLIHASMLFQGPIPPILSIAGGSLGFLTNFEMEETVDAIRIAMGLQRVKDKSKEGEITAKDELEVFQRSVSSYPHESLIIQRPRQSWDGPKAKATFGMAGVICMTIRMRLDCRVVTPDGLVRDRYNVLNEVVIDRGSSSYLAALECFCDDVHLTTVQADGIIFATPTGSTAYSMAAGGSVVHPAVPCILVTPICPHVLSFRSMVFPDHVVLRCYVPEDARSPASVAFDGKHRQELARGDSVQIQMSAYPVPTLNRGDHSSDWLESLKRSFNFNTRPRQKPL